MATPAWEPGKLYPPGSLVVPRTAPQPGTVAITNPGFETGDAAGWTLDSGASIGSGYKYQGSYAARMDGATGITRVTSNEYACQAGVSITASCMYGQGSADSGHNAGSVFLRFFDASHTQIGGLNYGNVITSSSGGFKKSTVTAVSPAGTTYVRIGGEANRDRSDGSAFDNFAWNLLSTVDSGMQYKAVQAATGYSDDVEPIWPTTAGLTVVDNEVIWEAVLMSRIVWEAVPLYTSGATEPAWPDAVGESVIDGTFQWEAISRRVEDENCPNTTVTAIIASKVYKADRDIVRFSATVNPLDWTTAEDAGYLPTGLQQANANDMAVLQPYRGNLTAFNASSFQNWQVDPDPANMTILDQMNGVGSVWQGAAQAVGNELFYLSQLGVRSVGIAAATQNLQAGDVGAPVDPIVREVMAVAKANSLVPLSTYYPSAGQYWLAFPDYPPPALGLSGDVPDGNVGEAISGAYTASGGVLPYGPITVTSGTFPPGLTLNPDGTYSGTCTTAGSYSWTVGVIDALGGVATIGDSADVSAVDFGAMALSGGEAVYAPVGDGTNWSAAEQDIPYGEAYIYALSGPDRFVVWSLGAAAFTTDRATWTASSGSLGNSGGARYGAYHDGNYYICGATNPVYRSTDNAASFSQVVGSPHIQYLAIIGTKFLTIGAEHNGYFEVGDSLTGPWLQGSFVYGGINTNIITDGSSIHVAGTVHASVDGSGIGILKLDIDGTVADEALPTVPGATNINDVAYNYTHWVAITDNGYILRKEKGESLWEIATGPLAANGRRVTWTGNNWVATYDQSIWVSTDLDASNWNQARGNNGHAIGYTAVTSAWGVM